MQTRECESCGNQMLPTEPVCRYCGNPNPGYFQKNGSSSTVMDRLNRAGESLSKELDDLSTETKKSDVNWVVFIVLMIFGLWPFAVIYLIVKMAKK